VTTAKPASAEEALAALRDLADPVALGLRFSVLAPRETGTLRAHRVNLTGSAAQAIAEIATATRDRVLDATQLEYAPALLIPRGHCMHVAESAAATLSAVQAEADRTDVEVYDAGADYAAKAAMLAARFSDASGRHVTYYRVGETLLKLSKRRLLELVLRDGYYDRLEPTDTLLMRTDFDVVAVSGYAFFFTKTRFEQAFGFLEQLQRASGETFDAVTSKLRIEGLEALRAACTSQPQMMAKMASIRRSMEQDPAYAKAMSMQRLVDFVHSHPQLAIEVEGVGASARLVFNPSPPTRFKILNLLDDDYLRSVITERDYEASSKVRT
jgi:hypothetical protein